MASSPLVGWQNGDSTRGTLSIIKTCIATIFTCTWTIQHLNVPAAQQGELHRLLRVCKWMLITILLPEFILAKAILELALAARCMRKMEVALFDTSGARGRATQYNHRLRYGTAYEHPTVRVVYPMPWQQWSAIRSRLGLDWRRPDEEPGQEENSDTEEKSPPAKHTWTLTHAYFANMGGFVYTPLTDDAASPKPAARPLTGMQFAEFYQFFSYPSVTEEEIKDRSKTDVLAKAFSVLQISHLVLSLIVRRAQGLPSSQLEILTLAFAVCGVATYAVYWHKPKDVGVPVHVGLNSVACAVVKDGWSGDMLRLDAYPSFDSFWRVATNNIVHGQEALDRVPNDNIPIFHSGYTYTATLLLAFISAVFGSLHAIAWDFNFPTAAEKTIWHVCTILSITLPPLGLLAIPLSQATWRQTSPRDFLYASVRVLREFSWQLDDLEDRHETDSARHELENVYNADLAGARNSRAKQVVPYKDILWPEENLRKDRPLRQRMLDFVDKKAPFQDRPDLDLPPGYAYHLHRLVRLMNGEGSKKMVEGVARTNVFPRRELPPAFNIGLIYVTMGMYCVARVTLVAVGLSSLRAMPEPVYKSTWVDYMPAI